MKKKIIIISAVCAAALAVLGIILIASVYNGVIILNERSASKYPVKGVDVSHYQGEIDWQTLSKQDISFAFIKATEGSTFTDEKFAYNYEESKKAGLDVGAYHFFSYDSEGLTQAENFINTVAPFEGMLSPVIDLEFYGDKEKNPPKKDDVDEQLKAMLDALEEYYGLKPIIYATGKSYRLYLENDYEEYDIWIRDVLVKPDLSDNREWRFWQYTDRGQLDGYTGEEKYIDINVFNGTAEEYRMYLTQHTYKGAKE